MFASGDLIFCDFETRSTVDIRKAGTAAYVRSCEAIVLAYAIGDGPVRVWHENGRALKWPARPHELSDQYDAGARFAAWNSPFDRAVWNHAFPAGSLDPDDMIDVMVQATASNLPAGLDKASEWIGREGKQKDGKKLIRLFCVDGASPTDHPEEWTKFLDYAARDVEAMREVYKATRPLPLAEWEEFWAAEAINERGIGVDVEFAGKAAQLAARDSVEASERIAALTGGAVRSITQVGALTGWVYDRLDSYGRSLIETIVEEDDDTGDEDAETKVTLSLRRKQITALLAYLRTLPAADPDLVEALALREYGGGAAPKKFGRMVAQADEGRLKFQFSFNGASQTGRFSGKGVQLQNMTRQSLDGYELTAMDAILDGATPASLRALNATPVSRQLALLVRPSLIAEEGNTLVWSDWSQIEARVLPWLSGSRGGDAKLDLFRKIDADPKAPDIYMHAAAGMYGIPIGSIAKDSNERQSGKIAELALGFNGGKGALQSMAANYDLHFSDGAAQEIVDKWRQANGWCVRFWGKHRGGESYGLWGAAMRAIDNPGMIEEAGRVAFRYVPSYLKGTLFMALPSGRLLTYPGLKLVTSDEVDRATGKKTGDTRTDWTFRRQHGRVKLWPGLFAENATQACAADILRGTLKRLVDASRPVVAHVHDEIILEVPEVWADDSARNLRHFMRLGFDWSAGLPLWSDETTSVWYTKRKVKP